MAKDELRRLFWGLSLDAPWPLSYPSGRLIEEGMRHLTLAFLGNVSKSPLMEHLKEVPIPPFTVGPVGQLDKVLFLPENRPRVVANNMRWLTDEQEVKAYQKSLTKWLTSLGYSLDSRPFLSHVTIARSPFKEEWEEEWNQAFTPLPARITGICLYESLGNLHYETLWEYPFILPFEEFAHTADIAFHIRGKTFRDLYIHGAVALAFHSPEILSYLREDVELSTQVEVVAELNKMVSRSDIEIGSPFKAVSYSGKIMQEREIMNWEMIVDV